LGHTASLGYRTANPHNIVSFDDRLASTMLRMSDTTTSEAARQLVAKRWGPQRPVKLARELVSRIEELPASERARLRAALDEKPKGN
jgi:hypothetical protein